MKKFTKILALTLVLVMSVVMLASCGGPNADPDKAVDALKDNGYEASQDKRMVPVLSALIGIEKLESVVSAVKADDEFDAITIFYFEDKAAANDAWDKVEDYINDEIDDDADWIVKKSGAMIYAGSKDAIKAAK